VVLYDLKIFPASIESYDKAIEIDENYAEAWNGKALSLYEIGEHKEEIDCYNRAIKIKPNFSEAWTNKGATYLTMEMDD